MNKQIVIREEQDGEKAAVFQLETAAFGRELEAGIVDKLREAGAVVLSLVALVDGQIVGHALYSTVELRGENGDVETAVALGPIGVHPDWQKRGIGGELIREGNGRLQQQGVGFIFVLGHSDYYPKFGFTPTAPFGIRSQYDVPDDVFMVAELIPNALKNKSGTVHYHAAFG